MTWEWSHTAEGYAAAYENLHAMPRNELVVIAAEWDTWKRSKEKKVVKLITTTTVHKVLVTIYEDGTSEDEEEVEEYVEEGEEEEVDAYDDGGFDQVYYAERLEFYKAFPSVLADYIWPLAEEQSNCTNGGHQLWMCPYDCHTVPPHRDDEEAEEEE